MNYRTLVRRRRLIVDLDDLGSFTRFVQQLLLREKIVREDPVQLPNLIKQIQLFDTVVPLLCHQFTNSGPVLLLDVSAVVLVSGPGAREGDLLFFTEPE